MNKTFYLDLKSFQILPTNNDNLNDMWIQIIITWMISESIQHACECTLRYAHVCLKVFGVQLYKNNAYALLSCILSILNSDWLQHARSVSRVNEYKGIHLLSQSRRVSIDEMAFDVLDKTCWIVASDRSCSVQLSSLVAVKTVLLLSSVSKNCLSHLFNEGWRCVSLSPGASSLTGL